jgi:hypothetical protein
MRNKTYKSKTRKPRHNKTLKGGFLNIFGKRRKDEYRVVDTGDHVPKPTAFQKFRKIFTRKTIPLKKNSGPSVNANYCMNMYDRSKYKWNISKWVADRMFIRCLKTRAKDKKTKNPSKTLFETYKNNHDNSDNSDSQRGSSLNNSIKNEKENIDEEEDQEEKGTKRIEKLLSTHKQEISSSKSGLSL